MALIADMLLIAGALGAALYCMILARRVARLSSLESGMGGAIAVLSAEVDGMTRALSAAQGTAAGSATQLSELSARAEETARRLELLLASLHDMEAQAQAAAARADMRALPGGMAAADPDEGTTRDDDPGQVFLTRRARHETARAAQKVS
jgi:hypothetical protein